MDVVLTNEVRTARKSYRCDATAWWHACGMTPADCTSAAQLAAIAAADADGGRILPGQRYRYARGVFEGAMVTWRARVDVDQACMDHGLYD